MTQWFCRCPKCNKYSLMIEESTMKYFKCDYCDFDTRYNTTENFKANSITIKLKNNNIEDYSKSKGE